MPPFSAPWTERSRLAASLALALLLVAPAAHAQAPEAPPARQKEVRLRAAEETPGSPLQSGLDTIEKEFIVPIPRDQLETKTLAVLLESLDPYSHYLDAAQMDMFTGALDGSFPGIGIQFGYADPSGYPDVAYFVYGGSAEAAGVRRGDLLLAIDGHELKDEGWERVSHLLRGQVGAPVLLRLRRAGVPEPIEIKLTRVAIDMPSVRAAHRDVAGTPDWWLDRERKLGYMRLASVVADSAPRVDAAVQALERGGARGLVIDLRDCAGGLLESAVDTADLFVDRGRLLTIHQRSGDRSFDARRGKYTRLPLAILINGESRSACEVLAAALADNGRGTLVGERSYGKGRMQVIYTLGAGRGGMVMSTGTFQRPNGKTIDRHDVPEGSKDVGIAPQVEVKMSEAEHKAWLEHAEKTTGTLVLTADEQRGAPPDPVLAKAVELLSEK